MYFVLIKFYEYNHNLGFILHPILGGAPDSALTIQTNLPQTTSKLKSYKKTKKRIKHMNYQRKKKNQFLHEQKLNSTTNRGMINGF